MTAIPNPLAKPRRRPPRYRRPTAEERALIAASFSPRVMTYVMKGNRMDTWRVRYLLQIAAEGASMGGEDPKRIEQAMLEWLKNPSRETLNNAERDLSVDTMGWDPSLKKTKLTGADLFEVAATAEALGGSGFEALTDPKNVERIRTGGKAGADLVYKDLIREGFGLPENALHGRDAKKLLNAVAGIAMAGMDEFQGHREFWDDYKEVEQGQKSFQEFQRTWNDEDARNERLSGWGGGDNDATRRQREKWKEMAERMGMKMREAEKEQNQNPDGKPVVRKRKKKTGPTVTIEVESITIGPALPYEDQIVYADEAQTIPWLVIRSYYKGSPKNVVKVEILVADEHGRLAKCGVEYESVTPDNPATPMVWIRPTGCQRRPGRAVPKASRSPLGVD